MKRIIRESLFQEIAQYILAFENERIQLNQKVRGK